MCPQLCRILWFNSQSEVPQTYTEESGIIFSRARGGVKGEMLVKEYKVLFLRGDGVLVSAYIHKIIGRRVVLSNWENTLLCSHHKSNRPERIDRVVLATDCKCWYCNIFFKQIYKMLVWVLVFSSIWFLCTTWSPIYHTSDPPIPTYSHTSFIVTSPKKITKESEHKHIVVFNTLKNPLAVCSVAVCLCDFSNYLFWTLGVR